ncbi:hypothetical protein D3C80_1538960 [compost metagenome]
MVVEMIDHHMVTIIGDHLRIIIIIIITIHILMILVIKVTSIVCKEVVVAVVVLEVMEIEIELMRLQSLHRVIVIIDGNKVLITTKDIEMKIPAIVTVVVVVVGIEMLLDGKTMNRRMKKKCWRMMS